MDNLSNIEIGIRLLCVGMITVFIILFIVVLLAKGLIFLTNKMDFLDDEVHPVKLGKKVENKKVAILSAVVLSVTNGQGKIKEIRKL